MCIVALDMGNSPFSLPIVWIETRYTAIKHLISKALNEYNPFPKNILRLYRTGERYKIDDFAADTNTRLIKI